MNDHLTPDTLQHLMDGELAEELVVAARDHLRTCPSCASAAQGMRRFDRALRGIPLIHTTAHFTQDVMGQLHIAPRPSLAFRILEHAGSVFGAALVLSVLLVVFVSATGPGSGGEGGEEGIAGTVMRTMDSALDQGLAGVAGWLTQVFSHGTIGVWLMLMLTVPAIALVDWLWGRKRVLGG